jgi:hypothetical protein
MGRLDDRLNKLERRIPPPKDEADGIRRAITVAILEEFGRLKACRANRHYRGGTPPAPIQPTDPAGDVLGYPYTTGQLVECAIRNVVGRIAEDQPDLFADKSWEDLAESWAESWRAYWGDSWDEIHAEGPPEPTPPWH